MMVSDVPQIIESCGFCRAEKVKSLQTMKSGMTNRSYSFCVDDKRYIIRIPGEGTDRLINRKQEHAVYNAFHLWESARTFIILIQKQELKLRPI